MREGDEVQVDGEQHELDRHQQHDDVAPVEEDAHHADREQDRAEHQIVVEAQHHSFSDGMDTISTRSWRRTRTCSAGSWWRLSLRLRSVRAIAAMMATSRITAAISKA